MQPMSVELLPAFSDNYIALIVWDSGCCVVDPGDAEPVLSWVRQHQVTPCAILNTHHHADHTAGNERLVKEFGCPVIGPDDARIPKLTQKVKDSEVFPIGPLQITALATPGHTRTHLAYYLPEQGWLFAGDCLFGAGCGRIFEGTGEQMWQSLQRLMQLPDETQIYCGHEYTLPNLEYAEELEPHNLQIHLRLNEARRQRAANQPTLPFTVAMEKATNPWVRQYSF
jgi:hydroxyacylglutathione hydrolase